MNNKGLRIFKKYVLWVYVIALFFVCRTPVKAGYTPYTAVKAYNSFLSDIGSGAFSVVYLNNNSIPDMVYDYNNDDAFTIVFVDGEMGTLDGHRVFVLDRNSRLKDRDIFYYPKKSLLEITDSKYAVYEDYYYRLSKAGAGETDLWRILYQDSDGKVYQGCTQSSRVSSGKTYGSYWDQLLEKWIVRYKISDSKFFSVLDKLVGSTEPRYCVLYNNTSANRSKYVNANSYVTASIKLNKSSASLRVGETLALSAKVTGKSKTVAWSSSDTGVATVSSSGKVTAKKAGKATITAKAGSLSAKCTITVYGKDPYEISKNFILTASQVIKKFGMKCYGQTSEYAYGYSLNGKDDGKTLEMEADSSYMHNAGYYIMGFRDTKHAAFGTKVGMSKSEIEKLLKKQHAVIFYAYKSYTNYRFGKWELLVYYTNGKATGIYLTIQKYSNGERP